MLCTHNFILKKLYNKIINGLTKVSFDGILIETYKGTWYKKKKHNNKFCIYATPSNI